MSIPACLFATSSAAQETKEVRIALPLDYLPLSGVNIAGETSGILPDIWHLWSQKTGVPVTFVSGSFSDTLSDLRNDRADVHGSLFRSDVRETWLDFSRPFHEVSTSTYYLRSAGNISSLNEARGRTAGVIGDTYQEDLLQQSDYGLSVVPFSDPLDMLRALDHGDISLLIHEDLAMSQLLERTGFRGEVVRLPGEIARNTVSAAWKKSRPELRSLLDWGFSQISQMEYAEIEARWIQSPDERFFKPAGSYIPFTTAEKEWLDRHKIIRVGFQNNWPPISSVNGDLPPEGMSIEFVELMNERLGGVMTLVPGSWNELLDAVEDKRLDAVIDIWPIRSRMGKYAFTNPYLTIPQVFAFKEGGVDPKDLDNLTGRTIALEQGYAMADIVHANYPGIRVFETMDTLAALQAVASGKADFWAGNLSVVKYLMETYPAELNVLRIGSRIEGQASTLTVGVREDWGIFRNILNKAITGINPAQEKFITDAWLFGKVSDTVNLSSDEQRWLARHRDNKIRVLAEDWPPFNYAQNGKQTGMAIDYLRHAFKELGLQPEFIALPWTEALQGIADTEKLDVIPALSSTPERAQFLAFTESYLSFPTVIFTRDNAEIVSELNDLAGKNVAVERGFITETNLSHDYPDINLVRFETTEQAVKAVSLGQADAYVGNLASGTFYIQKNGLSNLKIAAPTNYNTGDNAMGVRRDWPELASMLSKVLAQMTSEQHTRIRSAALAVRYDTGIDIKKILTYALPIAGVIMVIIVVIVVANRKLSREVEQRKRIQEELAERETWFKSLLESAPDATVIVSPNGNIVRVNKQAEILFGVNRHDLIDKKIECLVPDSTKNRHVGYRHGFITSSAPREMAANTKLKARRWDGTDFPVEISLSPIPTKDGILIAASVRDVTERRAAERDLEEKDIQLTAALENMSGGMFMVDKDQKIRVFNKKFVELYALPDIRVGMPLQDLILFRARRGDYGPGDVEKILQERLAGFQSSKLIMVEDRTTDGSVIESYRQPITDGGMVCVFNDITVRKMAEDGLATQTRKLQELSKTLSRYLSPQIYEAIFAGATDANVRTERKKLTVVFSDIKNFTATTEEMEPEDMTFLLNDYLTKMTQIALEHGGTIDKYIGDAIMVFFGDPDTNGVKEDALAAVRMAVAMQRRMVDLRAKWADMGYRHPFHIRCGVNTGYCNVGNFGSEQRVDYTIIGGQVNLAARLESICPPDGVTIAHETYTHIRDEFDAEPMPPITVKGIRDAVEPYTLTGIIENWDESERYIRRDDVKGLRVWVDLMRMNEEQRLESIRELEDVVSILRLKSDEGKETT